MKFWNVYRRDRGMPAVGDTVQYRGGVYVIQGSVGADSEGVPYVRLLPTNGNGKPVVALLTNLEKSA